MTNKQTEKPFRSSIPEDILTKARKMREEGITYQAIVDSLGVVWSTLHYALNPEIREGKNEYRKDHKAEVAEYRENHKVETAEYNKEYRKNHSAELVQWRKNHRDEAVEYYENHKAEAAEYGKEYRKNNPEKLRAHSAKHRALIKGSAVGNLDEIKEIYCRAEKEPDIQCYICGKLSQIGDRAVDHVYPVSKGYSTALFNLAIVHASCNGRKKDKLPDEIEVYNMSTIEQAREGIESLASRGI